MAPHVLASTMQVLADEDLLTIIMDNIDNPKTLCDLVMALPTAKATFERCPRQLLMAALSNLPSDIQLLAILYISLTQDHVSRASMISQLWDYLRLDDTPGIVEPPGAAVDFAIPKEISNPFETLRKLAAVWSAIEDLACGFIKHSIQFIQNAQDAKDAGLETVYYTHGYKLRPLSHLWDEKIRLQGRPTYETLVKPQPWTLPLPASEIHRVKTAMWRLEVFAVVSRELHTLPNESATALGVAELHCADFLGTFAGPLDHAEGTRMLLASLQGSELAELESVYDYLWCETIEKAYQNKLDRYLPQYDGDTREVQAGAKGERNSRGVEYCEREYDRFRAYFAMERNAERAKEEHDRHLTYLMSLGLPFLHRVYRQIVRDGNEIIPKNYPLLRYRSLYGLRDTWNEMDKTRYDNIWRSYNNKLVHINPGTSITRRSARWPPPENYPGLGTHFAYGAMYLQTRVSNNFRMEDLWRAGCYMW